MAAQLALFPLPSDAPALQVVPRARKSAPRRKAEPLLIPLRCERGDLWQLGRHRLLVSDSTDAGEVARLMAGARADILIADPPYGMRLDTDFTSMSSKPQFATDKHAFGGHAYATVLGDHEDFSAVPIVSQFQAVREQFWFGADYYAATLGDTQHSGSWLVWDKRTRPEFDRMFGSCFELIWSRKKHKRDILRHVWAGIFGMEHEPTRGRRVHPTQKPVRLFEDLLGRYSKSGMVMVDPYAGSGTALIACERTDRTCYACEIEPQYASTILARWEQLTGGHATLLDRRTSRESAS